MDLKRFSIVPVDSSAARIPLPRATIAFATLASSLMIRLLFETNGEERRVRQGSILLRGQVRRCAVASPGMHEPVRSCHDGTHNELTECSRLPALGLGRRSEAGPKG